MLDWLNPDGPEFAKAFASTFSAEPRPFGSPSLPIGGVSDGVEGVQWSMEFDTAEQQQRVLVNLEGIVYSGWPIARLILNELESPQLLGLTSADSDQAPITVWWRRDYWQVTARPPIRERNISPTPIRLRDLTEESWRSALCSALGCLDAERARRGRATQVVTLEKDGRQVTGPVSPHLQIAYNPVRRVPWSDLVVQGRAVLQDIYDWARRQAGG